MITSPAPGLREAPGPFPDLSTLPPDGGPEFNRLVFTSSPYLLQHARNPVDWYPWEDAAFERARNEDRPVFLSIGYSTCHWCHVMEHESFEDAEVAAELNRGWVAIKVDREERPDIDAVYMQACQLITGSGGWPLSVFLTPDRRVFYAGTYFPKHDRHGRPGFLRVLRSLREVWDSDRGRILVTSGELASQIASGIAPVPGAIPADLLPRADRVFLSTHDREYGGFGGAPKFPMGHVFSHLFRRADAAGDAALAHIAEHTLLSMRKGGIRDHLGGGFCRYSVDRRWIVPHFEKMLYDNALLLSAYVDAFQYTRDSQWAEEARDIITYVQQNLTDPDGGFYSGENADSEGEEGRFYVFTADEVRAAVEPLHSTAVMEYFGVTQQGNFEHGRNVLHLAVEISEWRATHGLTPAEADRILREARNHLLAYRNSRVRPSLDDKILTSWNGLMISALARASQALGDETALSMARAAAAFMLSTMRRGGTLYHRYRRGATGIHGFLEDYAFLVHGLIDVYEATFESTFLLAALDLTDEMLTKFGGEETDALYQTEQGNDELPTRPIDGHDGALPSGNSIAAMDLLRLARLTGDIRLEARAESLFEALGASIAGAPSGHASMLTALDFSRGRTQEIVIAAGNAASASALADVVRRSWRPRTVLLLNDLSPGGDALRARIPMLASMTLVDGRPAAYLCRNFACEQPVTDPSALEDLLR